MSGVNSVLDGKIHTLQIATKIGNQALHKDIWITKSIEELERILLRYILKIRLEVLLGFNIGLTAL